MASDAPDPGERTILVRAGIGAAGRVIQRSDLTARRITVEQPTLILVEDGVKRLAWPDGMATAGAGDALAVQPGTVVDIANTPGPGGSYRALWISWSPELVPQASAFTSARVTALSRLESAFRGAIGRALDALGDAGEPVPDGIVAHRLHEVLAWLGERGFRFAPPAPETVGARIRRLLAADPAGDWSMDAVARGLGASVATLRRRLATESVTFRDLLQDVWMEHALTLLQNTDAPVLNIAFAVGYDSPSRFSTRFRTRFGFLPSDIRGQARGRAHPSLNTAYRQVAGDIR
jgi:AraC-like DNA-binding protein